MLNVAPNRLTSRFASLEITPSYIEASDDGKNTVVMRTPGGSLSKVQAPGLQDLLKLGFKSQAKAKAFLQHIALLYTKTPSPTTTAPASLYAKLQSPELRTVSTVENKVGHICSAKIAFNA
jgi:hypothetical protein